MGLFIIAVAVEIVFSIATVGAAISLPFAITRNIQIIGKHAVLKETLEATDSPHDILRPKLDTYYSGTYYCGQELLFDEDVIAWLHQCRRNWILSEIKRMHVHLRKSRIRIYKE